jgi:metallo-beta-lactamase class B
MVSMDRRNFVAMTRAFALLGLLLLGPRFASGETRPGNQPNEPYRIAGNLYYVGADDITSYVIATSEGHVLVNPGFEETVPIIRANMKTLGLRYEDIRVVLNGQAHIDHVAGCAAIRRDTTARVMAMVGDADIMEGGGKGDFRFDGETSWPPCKVDRVLHDGDEVKLGGVVLHAVLTAGHTKGCTTWTFDLEDGGRRYAVVIVGGLRVNPGVVLVGNPRYPRIVEDYAKTYATLRSLKPDFFLGAHQQYYDGLAKAKRRGEAKNPFIDPDGYRAYLDVERKLLDEQIAREKAAAKP